MKSLICKLFFLMSFSLSAFAQQKADDIVGVWFNASKEAKIKVFKSSDQYYGAIVWLKNPLNEQGKPKVDDKNPNEKDRNKPINGLVILRGFTFSSNEWTDGRIYDPKNGKDYSCTIKKEGDKLQVRGYIGISLIGRTETWTKTE